MIRHSARRFSLTALLLPAVSVAQTTYYVSTPLTSSVVSDAPVIDRNLKNPWGLAAAPNGPWWVADEQSGLSSVYSDTGAIQPVLVSIPSSQFDNTKNGTPTGIVYNGNAANFLGASYIYCTYDGTISAILDNAPVSTVEVDNGAIGSSYTGIAIVGGTTAKALLYAANFASGKIEVYNTAFQLQDFGSGAFTDPSLPSDYHPFNVVAIGVHIFVTYGVYSSSGVVKGSGNGAIDVYNAKGVLEMQFAKSTLLNAPWGMAVAPATFGQYGGALLIAQQGSGIIVAFDATTGTVSGALDIAAGTVLEIPEVWGIAFGSGGVGGPSTTLFYTCAQESDAHGLFGTVTVN